MFGLSANDWRDLLLSEMSRAGSGGSHPFEPPDCSILRFGRPIWTASRKL